jgi:hypothetical protein
VQTSLPLSDIPETFGFLPSYNNNSSNAWNVYIELILKNT